VSDLDLEERHLQALLRRDEMKVGEDGWTASFDLAPLFLNLTLDVATEFLYGQSVRSQDAGNPTLAKTPVNAENPDFSTFGQHLDAGKASLFMKGLAGRWNGLINSRNFAHHRDEVHRMVDEFVEARLRQDKSPQQTEKSENKRFYLLDELAKYTQDPLELRSETLHVLNAGRDTTGALLGWTFYFLARNPHVYEKLRAIVIEEIGSSGSEISFQDLKSCKYLQNVINETLRVSAPVPMNERFCICDTTLPRGGGTDGSQPIFLPKGSQVLISTFAMQHRADIWGADVNEFKPERWENRRAGWEFMPFGGGSRKCIGRKYRLFSVRPTY
jgi:cytochrome P450